MEKLTGLFQKKKGKAAALKGEGKVFKVMHINLEELWFILA